LNSVELSSGDLDTGSGNWTANRRERRNLDGGTGAACAGLTDGAVASDGDAGGLMG